MFFELKKQDYISFTHIFSKIYIILFISKEKHVFYARLIFIASILIFFTIIIYICILH